MSALADLLEDFGTVVPSGAGPASGVDADEIARRELQSYEQGYRAGRDDAVRAQDEDSTRLAGDFAQNLKDLSFTYHEAYSHVLRAMTPLLRQIVETILPVALHDGLGAHVAAELEQVAARCGGLAAEVAVAPESLAAVAPFLARDFGFPVDLVPDASLREGQAELRLPDREQRIDLDGIAEGLRTAIAAFRPDMHEERAYG
ncbi:hypothetical protein [Roseivivax isoporae]|uniref:ABC transporter ATP-binding protein n=1 Tax=Roseivivax isoporae LMG 25204 TaxID=1449351 RepID=X7F9R9_9RHOB|nr:hypothetical protein [Roseivivax isoporae]ETX29642.1 ABC transporter ATP-binding protein [Roseivivax isoporae LMG 25204]